VDHDLQQIAKIAVDLAIAAGDILREGREKGFGRVLTKSSDVDIVTEIDKASEQYISSALREQRPDDAVIGEEGTAFEGTSGVRWVVDPLDGTVNFTYGIPHYCVSIGVEADGVPVVGVVYNPATDQLYRAVVGSGASCNGEQLQVRNQTKLATALIATGFSYSSSRRALQADVLTRLAPHVRDIRRFGSAALDMCAVAAGTLDGYYELGTHPWDVTAGEVIASEAGARVSGFDGGRPVTDVIATEPAVYDALRAIVGTTHD
jgi:myo-inositol-1(or 4)-monophosphatase